MTDEQIKRFRALRVANALGAGGALRCELCLFFDQITDASPPTSRPDVYGYCGRFPPRAATGERGGLRMARYPLVDGHEWCAEHVPLNNNGDD